MKRRSLTTSSRVAPAGGRAGGQPLSSVLLAAHAKVLAALSGEREVATGYVGRQGGQPLPCRLTTEPDSWRALLLATHRAESELLAHSDFPVDDLRRDLSLTDRPSRLCSIRPCVRSDGVRSNRARSDRHRGRPCRGHRVVGRHLAQR